MATLAFDISQLPIAPTAGAGLIGSYLAAMMYGLTILQTYQYFSRYWGADRTHVYVLVIVLTVLDTFSMACNIHMMWHFLIANYCNPLSLLFADWSTLVSILANGVIGIIVQVFYAYRLWMLSDRKEYITPIVIVILGIGALVSCNVHMAQLYKHGTFLQVAKLAYLPTMYFSFSIGADALITFGITFWLMRHRNRGMRSSTNDDTIRKLITYTINAGAITTLCCVISLILCRTIPNSFYDLMFALPLSKCYVNSILGFLNAREELRKNRGLVTVNLTTSTTSKTTSYYGTQLDMFKS
ncbi:unnamed protein product [Cyclocybe aegerita]|uniref:DUF6534 domain-containing protein n=1 Tax=Cyclocybe aegerita TaxID=1973307 RepID=A0A8S0XHJ1_CYCAE|nr:unnamed protein product [Cyclocybe aegerita]